MKQPLIVFHSAKGSLALLAANCLTPTPALRVLHCSFNPFITNIHSSFITLRQQAIESRMQLPDILLLT